jgi:hypothetical protein
MTLNPRWLIGAGIAAMLSTAALSLQAERRDHESDQQTDTRNDRSFDGVINRNADALMARGRKIFRFDTFGDEAFWGDTLKLLSASA